MKRTVYFVILLSMLFQIGIKGNSMLSTLYAVHLEASPFSVGLIVALVALFPMVLAVYAGRVSDHIGFRLPLTYGSFAGCLAFLLPFIFNDLLFILFITQLLFGLGQIFFSVSMQNLIGALSDNNSRSNHFALLGLSVAAAHMIGPLITGFVIDFFSYAFAYLLLAIIVMIPGIVMILRLIPIPQGLKYDAQEHENAHVIDLLKSQSLRKAFITSGIILTGSSIFNFYFPIYGKHLGFTSSEIGLVLSANALAFFVIRMLMPVLLKKFKEEKILFNSLIITALCFLAVPLFKNVILLLCLAFLMGLGLGCGQPLSIVMAYNRSPTGRTGEVLGVRLTVNKIVLFTVPVIFGSLGTVLGFIPIFWSNAILLFLGGYFTFEKPKEKKD